MKTYSPKPRDIERRWYVIDASGVVLGRLASHVAQILRGKHKPIYAPHADTGDHVVVLNAKDIRLTGGKENTKIAYRHSGYPGGITAIGYARLLAERPAFAVEKAIKGMLPKNSLGRAMARKLQVYEGPEHPHAAQRPVALKPGEFPAWSGLPQPERKSAPEPKAPKKRAPAKPAGKKPAATKRAGVAKRTTAKRAPSKSAAGAAGAKRTSGKGARKTAPTSESKAPRTRRAKKEEGE